MDIETVLTRGVEQVLPSKKRLAMLMKKRVITLYQGFDPTSDKLHIGNLVGVRKLAQFQKLGHRVIFLIGDFTGMIGDPTDKAAARKKLTGKEVLENAKDYQKQIARVLNFGGDNPAIIKYNSSWLAKLTFEEIIELASKFTVQQMWERDFFQERQKKEKPIYIHEFLYPIMQGVDAAEMGVDLEIGGSDQLFNMLIGRSLVKAIRERDKFVLTTKLLTDPTGKKMGKTEGNTINLTDEPSEMFGKIMALPDSLIDLGIELLTDLPLDYARGKEPMEVKKRLAREVVAQIHEEEKAGRAQSNFERTFQKHETPKKMKVVKVTEEKMVLLDLVFEAKAGSRSEIKRLIRAGAVDVNGKNLTDAQEEIEIGKKGVILKVGKKKFVKVLKK